MFLSQELYERFGQSRFELDEPRLPLDMELTGFTEVHPDTPIETVIPPDIELPAHDDISKSATLVLPSDLESAFEAGTIQTAYAWSHTVASVFKRLGDFTSDERRLRQSESELSTNASAPEYSGPLFVYSLQGSDDTFDVERLAEQKGPINLGWKESLNKQATDVGTDMRSNGWIGLSSLLPVLSKDRYVILETPSGQQLADSDAMAGKHTRGITGQFHTRHYDIPDHMDDTFAVAGQAHKDPPDHNHIGNQSLDFAQSRDEVGSDWKSWFPMDQRSTTSIGNGTNYPSSQGMQDQFE